MTTVCVPTLALDDVNDTSASSEIAIVAVLEVPTKCKLFSLTKISENCLEEEPKLNVFAAEGTTFACT